MILGREEPDGCRLHALCLVAMLESSDCVSMMIVSIHITVKLPKNGSTEQSDGARIVRRMGHQRQSAKTACRVRVAPMGPVSFFVDREESNLAPPFGQSISHPGCPLGFGVSSLLALHKHLCTVAVMLIASETSTGPRIETHCVRRICGYAAEEGNRYTSLLLGSRTC